MKLAACLSRLGDVRATYRLGYALDSGNGIEQDKAEGLRLMESASDQGYPPAQTTMGLVYLNGIDVEQDLPRAQELLEAAAKQNDHKAQHILAYELLRGWTLPQDLNRAHELFEAASQSGNEDVLSMFFLGRNFHYGYGTEIDYEKAEHYYRLAIEKQEDFGWPQGHLGALYIILGKKQEALTWLLK